jgi:hypothetical protein
MRVIRRGSKLVLDKTVLRRLSAPELAQVAGGSNGLDVEIEDGKDDDPAPDTAVECTDRRTLPPISY